MKLTPEQELVANSKNRNLLVSAAAGSGKTAVLVEHILRLVGDNDQGTDVDRLLVVTFTKAAAAEMRSRLYKALQEKADENPTNEWYRRQLQLVNGAHVCTIDSFCMDVIRNNFSLLDMDPAFRMGDEGEIALLQADVMKEMLEAQFSEEPQRQEFIDFAETCAHGKNDSAIDDAILGLYRFSQSYPDPAAWLERCIGPYQAETPEDVLNASWYQGYINDLRMELKGALTEAEILSAECAEEGTPAFTKLACVINADIDQIKAVLEDEADHKRFSAEETNLFTQRISAINLPKNPAKGKNENEDWVYFKTLQEKRKAYKGTVEAIQKSAGVPVEIILMELQLAEPFVRELIDRTKDFQERFAEAKKKKKIADFNDMEHFAIEILLKDGKPTEAARRLSEQFEEIMIDEYQDSNEVQEALLTAVSKHPENPDNVFMVGDMKQSIYKFRMSRPEIFLEKYLRYQTDGTPQGKIELSKNFRSRASVIDSVNDVFTVLMHDSIGKIEYTDEVALHAAADFPDTDKNAGGKTELLILETDPAADQRMFTARGEATEGQVTSQPGEAAERQMTSLPGEATEKGENPSDNGSDPDGGVKPDDGSNAEDEAALELSAIEMEARMVAKRILDFVDPESGQYVYDGDRKDYRLARYSDIAILLRATTGIDSVYAEIFRSYGIPVLTESKSGYYNSWEIVLVINLLSVIDNPMNDIPLAAVLTSPLYRFTSEELSMIRICQREQHMTGGLYAGMKAYGNASASFDEYDPNLSDRIQEFLADIDYYREESGIRRLPELLRLLYHRSGLSLYAAAMPDGDKRVANLEVLLERATDFEATSYHGVFNFIRYIDKRRTSAMDEGEASPEAGSGNVVRIMTIHKSKGLQFPIVFVSGCGKLFNRMDENAAILTDPDLGIGVDAIDYEKRTRTRTCIRRAISQKIHKDNQGENLRLLYVAMTRAQEKLILTGIRNKFPGEPDKQTDCSGKDALFSKILSGKSFLEWLLLACPGRESIEMRSVLPAEVLQDMVEEVIQVEAKEMANEAAIFGGSAEPKAVTELNALKEQLEFAYDYDDLCRVGVSMSVSALKRKAMMAYEEPDTAVPEASFFNDLPADDERPRPRFMKETEDEESLSGAQRGTLYHLVLEHVSEWKSASETISELVEEGLISDLEKDTINPNKIDAFRASGLAKRFFAANARGEGFREKQFIIGRPVQELLPETRLRHDDELLMVQGIIDMFFEEPDGLVLVDYKTDRVKTAEELTERYYYQLELYGKALEQITGKKVKEKWIYSLCLGAEILL